MSSPFGRVVVMMMTYVSLLTRMTIQQLDLYNPMSGPFDNWESKFDISPGQNSNQSTEFGGLARHAESSITENDFTFPCAGSCEDDDVLTESNLEEKALDLKNYKHLYTSSTTQ